MAETNATLQESKELARATGIDPLKHSNLRVRGMYELHHPTLVFDQYITEMEYSDSATKIYLVILKSDLEKLEISGMSPDFTTFYIDKRLVKKEIICNLLFYMKTC